MQDLVRTGILKITKIHGEANPADVFTKFIKLEVLRRHLQRIGLVSSRDDHDGHPREAREIYPKSELIPDQVFKITGQWRKQSINPRLAKPTALQSIMQIRSIMAQETSQPFQCSAAFSALELRQPQSSTERSHVSQRAAIMPESDDEWTGIQAEIRMDPSESPPPSEGTKLR